MPKKIDVAVSSLVDLKAELYRKQGEFLKSKTKNFNQSNELYVKNKKPVFNDKLKKEKIDNKSEKSEKIKILEDAVLEEERQLKKSKEKLIQKTALYEKLSKNPVSNEPDEDGNSIYLVNFDQKLNTDKISDEDDDDEVGPSYSCYKAANQDIYDKPANQDEEWVEYTDNFGRTRRCMRKDLHKFIEADKKTTDKRTDEKWSETSQMLSKDMKNELERRSWEKAEEGATADSGPVHYQDVLRNEAWEHGVSYFNFSTDEAERKNQMKVLEDFRQQTIEQRSRNDKIKEKRKQQMKNRLEKVMERKKLKLDSSSVLDDSEEEIEQPESDLNEIPLPNEFDAQVPSGNHAQARKPSGDDAQGKKVPYVRPWDVGKPKFSQTAWVDKNREERQDEFAPPSSYYF